jgi:hypothetical protein
MKAGDAADPLDIEQDEGFSTEERSAPRPGEPADTIGR